MSSPRSPRRQPPDPGAQQPAPQVTGSREFLEEQRRREVFENEIKRQDQERAAAASRARQVPPPAPTVPAPPVDTGPGAIQHFRRALPGFDQAAQFGRQVLQT